VCDSTDTYSQRIWSPLSVMAVAPHKLREKICLANGDAAITSRVLSVNFEQKLQQKKIQRIWEMSKKDMNYAWNDKVIEWIATWDQKCEGLERVVQ
jgi:hypothetical protein